MAKTVAELQEEAKKKMQDQKNKKDQKQADPNKLEEAMGEIRVLKAQTTALQEQLNKNSSNDEETRLAQEAEAMKKEEEALTQEADIQTILSEALKTETPQTHQEDENPLSQKELASVIAEAVGRSVEASTKLTEGSFDKKIAASNANIVGLRSSWKHER